jgi:mono/diheme cytochrome c family protein
MQIWILLSDPAPIRSNVVTRTKELKINFPVLFDQHGLAARSVGLTRAGEVALVQPPAFTAAYRGEVAASGQLTASESFLGQALASLTGSRPLTFLRTPVNGPQLPHNDETTPDYATGIAPILHKHCAICHRPNGVAPFALTNYSVVEQWAPAIKHALLSGKMPPWHADPEYGRFTNDLSLPGKTKSDLIRWIDAGLPRGEGSDPLAELAPPPAFDEWPAELGEPDAVMILFRRSKRGSEPYRYIFTRTRTRPMSGPRRDHPPSNYQAASLSGLACPHRQTGSMDNSTYQSHIAEFVPGHKPFLLPADSYIPLASPIATFNLHYTPHGCHHDQLVLALYRKPPPKSGSGRPANTTFGFHTAPGITPFKRMDFPMR